MSSTSEQLKEKKFWKRNEQAEPITDGLKTGKEITLPKVVEFNIKSRRLRDGKSATVPQQLKGFFNYYILYLENAVSSGFVIWKVC